MKIFAHSLLDAWLVLISATGICFFTLPVVWFEQFSWAQLVLLGGVGIFVNGTNYQCVAHYFIHTPFFKSRWSNYFFSVFNSLALGVPQSLYYAHHMDHHQHGNQLADQSSIYRFSKHDGVPESILSYSIRGPWRTDYRFLVSKVSRLHKLNLLCMESLGLIIFMSVLFIYSAPGFLFYYLPVWYLGQIFAYAENYLEHFGGTPTDSRRNSVSCYSKWYNFIWFNNGYHQEHHCKPSVHWTRMPSLRRQMEPEVSRMIVRGAHWLNFPRKKL